MKKVKTELVYYRYNSFLQTTSDQIIWYVLQVDGQIEKGRCFTENELTQFVAFISTNQINFPNKLSILECTLENTPFCTAFVTRPNQPSNIILRKKPCLSSHISKCMDVVLCNSQGSTNHTYNLEFDVIGERLL